jgi:poly-gamma-glutamate capsule biosynthesis protein CapA/YwtB (metallophosphatase superfamily)
LSKSIIKILAVSIIFGWLGSGCMKVALNPLPEAGPDQAQVASAEQLAAQESASLPATAPVAVTAAAQILPEEQQQLETLIESSSEPLTLIAVGDIMLTGGKSEHRYRAMGHGAAFDYVRDITGGADVSFANVEGPITTSGPRFGDKKYTYKMAPAAAPAIAEAGFDIVSIANNHMLDFGAEGLANTIVELDRHNIANSGAGANVAAARAPAFYEAAGRKIALLSYSLTYPEEFWAGRNRPGTAFGHESWVRSDVAAVRDRADLVFVSFHWSAELRETPKGYQKTLAHAAIDSGADAVLGHHPHVPQSIEIYRGKPVFYSLGNFTFGTYSPRTTISFIARVTFDGENNPRRIELIPLDVNNFRVELQPRPAVGAAATKIIDHLRSISAGFNTQIATEGELGVIEIEPAEPELTEPEPTEPDPVTPAAAQ